MLSFGKNRRKKACADRQDVEHFEDICQRIADLTRAEALVWRQESGEHYVEAELPSERFSIMVGNYAYLFYMAFSKSDDSDGENR